MKAELFHSFALTLGYLRRLVADVNDAHLAYQPGAAVNHPAWVIGHLAVSCQGLAGEFGVEPWLPEGWADRYGTGSTPTDQRSAYPPVAELLAILDDSQRRIVAAVTALSEADLQRPLPDAKYREQLPTIGHAVLHILTAHAAIHVGQVTVWRRAMGLAPLTEPFA